MTKLRSTWRTVVPSIDHLESRQLMSVVPHHHRAALSTQRASPAPAVVVPTTTAVGPASANTVTGLHIATSPAVNRSFLNATAAIAANDLWAVGSFTASAGAQQPVIEHFNGTSWSVVPGPALPWGVSGSLNGVAALASNNVWAVGKAVGASSSGGLIEHWDGTRWSIVTSPTLATGGGLDAVTALSATNIWAVGSLGNGNGNLIEHFDGTRWSVVAAPSFTSNDALFGVSGTSGNDVWAVGKTGRHPGVEVLHFDGQSWGAVSAPSPRFDSELRSVTALSPTNVWAVGSGGTGPTTTLIEHFDGTRWSVVPSPNVGGSSLFSNNVLDGVAAISANDIWAVGNSTDPNTGFERTLTEHWDGTSWSVIASPNATRGHNVLNGVATLSTGGVVAVGYAIDSNGNPNGLILQK